MNTERYLHRIGMDMPKAPTADALKALTRAHLIAVPFENLEVTDEHREPSLETDALFDKIVLRKRGGYCFELNKAFHHLLCSLGYSCYPVAARVIHKRREPCPLSHRATVAVIDGKRYFCDVGFGGAGPKGIVEMEETAVQTVAGEQFTLREDGGSYVISILNDGIPEPVLRFRDEPWLDVDFATLSRYYATYPGSPFRNKRILYLCREDGWISLVQDLLTIQRDGTKMTRRLESEEEILSVIAEEFSLVITDGQVLSKT